MTTSEMCSRRKKTFDRVETRLTIRITARKFSLLRQQTSRIVRTAQYTNSHSQQQQQQKQQQCLFQQSEMTLSHFLPPWSKLLIPTDSLTIESHQLTEWPQQCETHYTVPLLGHKVAFSIRSRVVDRDCTGQLQNALQLSPHQLQQRTVEQCDICNDQQCDVKPDETSIDPCRIQFRDRLPLSRNWLSELQQKQQQKSLPISVNCCCVYSVLTVHVKIFGLQVRAEQFILQHMMQLWCKLQRSTVCWISEWQQLTQQYSLQLSTSNQPLERWTFDRVQQHMNVFRESSNVESESRPPRGPLARMKQLRSRL